MSTFLFKKIRREHKIIVLILDHKLSTNNKLKQTISFSGNNPTRKEIRNPRRKQVILLSLEIKSKDMNTLIFFNDNNDKIICFQVS